MRTPLIVANWKMHKTGREALAYVRELSALLKDVTDVEVAVAPSFTALPIAADAATHSRIVIAAQDVHFEREGAFTGAVSVSMIKDAGATAVIIGHSERRRLFGDTDQSVNRKVLASLTGDVTPIVCIGETLEERERGGTHAVLDGQIQHGLEGVTADQIASLVIAYEPVWAIGTGKNATSVECDDAHRHIRGRLKQWFGGTAGDRCRILYGGSVKPENVHEMIGLPDVDGALVGGASVDVRSFHTIVSKCRRAPAR